MAEMLPAPGSGSSGPPPTPEPRGMLFVWPTGPASIDPTKQSRWIPAIGELIGHYEAQFEAASDQPTDVQVDDLDPVTGLPNATVLSFQIPAHTRNATGTLIVSELLPMGDAIRAIITNLHAAVTPGTNLTLRIF
jgi:hypothetical protein